MTGISNSCCGGCGDFSCLASTFLWKTMFMEVDPANIEQGTKFNNNITVTGCVKTNCIETYNDVEDQVEVQGNLLITPNKTSGNADNTIRNFELVNRNMAICDSNGNGPVSYPTNTTDPRWGYSYMLVRGGSDFRDIVRIRKSQNYTSLYNLYGVALQITAPEQAVGEDITMQLGRDFVSSNNAAIMAFRYAGNGSSQNSLRIDTNGNQTSSTPAFVITMPPVPQVGNVGIHVGQPQYPLDVKGTTAIRNISSGQTIFIADVDNSVVNMFSNDGIGMFHLSADPTLNNIRLGYKAGQTNQSTSNAIALGYNAGNSDQATDGIAIGSNAGQTTQSVNSIALGTNAGQTTQGADSIAIGTNAGKTSQSNLCVAFGTDAGTSSQNTNSLAIGYKAGETAQGTPTGVSIGYAFAIGNYAGQTSQGFSTLAIGSYAAQTNQSRFGVAIGHNAGQTSQGENGLAVGVQAGKNTQGIRGVAVGRSAGFDVQGQDATAVGTFAGTYSQGLECTHIGASAGYQTAQPYSTGIGRYAGLSYQGTYATAVGYNAQGGTSLNNSTTPNVSNGTVAVGSYAQQNNVSSQAVAIGYGAGTNSQGTAAVAIGYQAGQTSQHANSIILNATGSALNSSATSQLLVSPMRTNLSTGGLPLFYDASTKEIHYNEYRVSKPCINVSTNGTTIPTGAWTNASFNTVNIGDIGTTGSYPNYSSTTGLAQDTLGFWRNTTSNTMVININANMKNTITTTGSRGIRIVLADNTGTPVIQTIMGEEVQLAASDGAIHTGCSVAVLPNYRIAVQMYQSQGTSQNLTGGLQIVSLS